MLTANYHEQALYIWERTALDIQDLPPLDPRRRIIGMLAGDRAGLTTDAAVQIDDHPITWRACCAESFTIGAHTARLSLLILRILIRAKSALEPVESVSDSDNEVTELRLGKFRSFAYGVAQ